ncbi:LysR family transcriptional regulator [Pectinatus haikarae]|uniref:DNA-binding transcriptional LysR family regulator n=1 Tax=Pectinatus haikarae TaxID=349096 RepID=A0ABT9YC87_9FIRM|nr:LysR family transcriptional regulator [Pectinatus haikarae]MDQ0205080.1 DNA-binding transcriptional LysR family regulator [Pectinatus haikarae]
MDIIKCKVLLTAVDAGSFSAAATILGYTPSGVTRIINALEKEIGFAILMRSHKGVKITKDGAQMLPLLRKLVHFHEQTEQLGAQIRGLDVGNLTIGTFYSIAACWLPEIIKAFQSDYPGIKVHTMEGANSDLLHWFEEHRIDCCFFSEYPVEGDWIPLKRDRLVVWLPQDHPKADLSVFPIEEINGAPFIETLPDCNTDIERFLREKKLRPDIRFTTIDNYTTYSMVAAGLGISLNKELMSVNWSGNVAIKPLDPPYYITLGIALPSLHNASPATKKFIAYAQKVIQNKYGEKM